MPNRSTPAPPPPQNPCREIPWRSEEHTSELQSHLNLVCRLLLEKKKPSACARPTSGAFAPLPVECQSPAPSLFHSAPSSYGVMRSALSFFLGTVSPTSLARCNAA